MSLALANASSSVSSSSLPPGVPAGASPSPGASAPTEDGHPAAERPAVERPAGERPAAERPAVEEVILRPEPGLARGIVETRPWVLQGLAVIVVVLATLYGASRMGLLRRRRARHVTKVPTKPTR